MDELKTHIGSLVSRFRKTKGMKQTDLASAVAMSPEAISNIERGASLPGIDTLVSIADALAVHPGDFMPSGPHDRTVVSSTRAKAEKKAKAAIGELEDHLLPIAAEQLVALSKLNRSK